MRVKPAFRSWASEAGVTDSGLASVVTSALGLSPQVASIASTIRPRSSGSSRVGVPPPTKTVSTVLVTTPAASFSSLSSASTYPSWLASPGA
jgi:hypothetical protein